MQLIDLFRRQFVLFRLLGVPVRADLRWVIVLIILSAVTAASISERVGDFGLSLGLGFAATLVFFVSIFLHEFAHALAAKMEKLEVVEIVLHPFGGLTRFIREPDTPRAEFRIAVAGPVASFLLTLVFLGLMSGANSAGLDILALLLFLLALSNFLLAVFNLFPGYPLDGGRVLRAYLWRTGRDLDQATILTGRCGQVIACGLILLGLGIVLLRSEVFTGFWAVLVGFFLYDSARSIIREVQSESRRTVDDEMRLAVPLDPEVNIQHVIDHILPLHRRAVFPVAVGRKLHGTLLLADIKELTPAERRSRLVRDCMRAVEPKHFIESGAPLAGAAEVMRSNGIGGLSVINSDGELVGFLSPRALP